MKNISDYNVKIVELGNVLETNPKRSHEQLIIRMNIFDAKETAQLFELIDGSRVKKSSLGVVKSRNDFYPDFRVYCLPEQVEETKAKLIHAVNKQTEKMLSVFQHIKSQVEKGGITMTAKEYRQYTIEMATSLSP